MDLFYVICSSPSCSFSAQGDKSSTPYCPYCGSKTLEQCPECGAYFNHKGQSFCHQCSARLKPEPEATLPHTSGSSS